MMQHQNTIELTEKQRLSWLQLARSENIGSASFWSLIEKYKSAENALSAVAHFAQDGGKRAIRIARLDEVEREYEKASRLGARYICCCEADYPPLLREMDGAPPIVMVRGNSAAFAKTGVAIVGSRNCSAVGLKLASLFGRELGQAGFCIVSGLARGIDAAAHRASCETGTLAVMAGGINHIYPPEHARLYDEILDKNGGIISEMPLGWTPRAIDFPRRNRLIAGLALGLLVVEAAQRSGSLISARIANDIGRIVFAIPGSPLDPRARGTNDLIKVGACLVTKPNDIIETLVPLQTIAPCHGRGHFAATTFEPHQQKHLAQTEPLLFNDDASRYKKTIEKDDPIAGDRVIKGVDGVDGAAINSEVRSRVGQALTTTPIDIEALAYHARVTMPQLYLALLELDIAGRLIRHPGGFVSLRPH